MNDYIAVEFINNGDNTIGCKRTLVPHETVEKIRVATIQECIDALMKLGDVENSDEIQTLEELKEQK